jgi:hypothetical protein
MLSSVAFLKEPFTIIVMITFSALIELDLLNFYSDLEKANWNMIV